jgi:hypothetical protein
VPQGIHGWTEAGADVAVAGPFIAGRVLSDQAGEGHDLAPGDDLARQLTQPPVVERLVAVHDLELDDAFLLHSVSVLTCGAGFKTDYGKKPVPGPVDASYHDLLTLVPYSSREESCS